MTNWPIDQFKIWYDLDEEKQAKGHSLLLWRPIFIFWHPNFETEHFVAIYRNWLASYFSEWGKQEMAHHPTPCVGSRRRMRKHSLDYSLLDPCSVAQLNNWVLHCSTEASNDPFSQFNCTKLYNDNDKTSANLSRVSILDFAMYCSPIALWWFYYWLTKQLLSCSSKSLSNLVKMRI